MRFILILLIISCGKPSKDCVSGKQKRLECIVERMDYYRPLDVPQFEINNCEQTYPENFCY